MSFGILRLTLDHSKCQGHTHFDFEYLINIDRCTIVISIASSFSIRWTIYVLSWRPSRN